MVAVEYGRLAGVASVQAGMGPSGQANAVAAATTDAAARSEYLALYSPVGRLCSLVCSIRDTKADADRGKVDMKAALVLSAELTSEAMEDFAMWYWRAGKYALPKSAPAEESQSDNPPSMQSSIEGTQA